MFSITIDRPYICVCMIVFVIMCSVVMCNVLIVICSVPMCNVFIVMCSSVMC